MPPPPVTNGEERPFKYVNYRLTRADPELRGEHSSSLLYPESRSRDEDGVTIQQRITRNKTIKQMRS